ncbi:MAG: phospholipase D-like domain-containing protein [Candidatus Thorarchaeota archaeon]|jgi:phosphatidylserine/phosphatidylglycerophosphate/cardiolipin synthase-like enzyme
MLSGFLSILISPAASIDPPQKDYTPSAITWQTFNKNMNVTTFVSPDGSKDALWHFLNSAEESIYVELYGINNPYIIELIHELHTTKPTLEMKFLIGWNSLGYFSPNDWVANNLTLLGYPVKWTSDSEFNYAHQKFVIIDNKTTIVHSGNWAKTSFPEDGNKANREWSIAMTDTDVTQYYRDVFDYDWSNGIDYDAGTHGTGTPLTYTGVSSTYANPFATPGEFSGPMNVTPVFSPETSLQGILYCINSAQATLDIQIPYFTNWNETGSVETILDAIIAAKNRGVTVRVISEEEYDFEEVAALLHQHNIPIVWQDTRWFTANHNKGIIVDGRIVLISSINYSDNSIENNREAGVIIENEDVAQWFQEIFDFDWSIADFDHINDVNLYWNPNIPSSAAEINVTVYAHELYSTGVTDVSLGVKIGAGSWNNYSITANVFASAEGQDENYFYVLSPQADGTNITVQASVTAGGVVYVGTPMVIRVRDSIGSIITTTTTTTGTTTSTTPTTPGPTDDTLMQLIPYIAIAIVAAIGGICFKKRR